MHIYRAGRRFYLLSLYLILLLLIKLRKKAKDREVLQSHAAMQLSTS